VEFDPFTAVSHRDLINEAQDLSRWKCSFCFFISLLLVAQPHSMAGRGEERRANELWPGCICMYVCSRHQRHAQPRTFFLATLIGLPRLGASSSISLAIRHVLASKCTAARGFLSAIALVESARGVCCRPTLATTRTDTFPTHGRYTTIPKGGLPMAALFHKRY
jgi:hypothetical protein